MKDYEFTVSSKGQEVTLSSQEPETVAEAIEIYGEKAVLSVFNTGKRSGENGYVRNLIGQDKSLEEIKTKFSSWKPGVVSRGKSDEEKALEAFAKLSPKQQARLKAALPGNDDDELSPDAA